MLAVLLVGHIELEADAVLQVVKTAGERVVVCAFQIVAKRQATVPIRVYTPVQTAIQPGLSLVKVGLGQAE